MSSSLVNSPLDISTKRFTPCVIACHCDKWLSQHLSYVIVEKFLSDLKKDFDREDNETIKIAKLKKIE